jgi:uncharacterized membrane protein YidH (DUF202 family)
LTFIRIATYTQPTTSYTHPASFLSFNTHNQALALFNSQQPNRYNVEPTPPPDRARFVLLSSLENLPQSPPYNTTSCLNSNFHPQHWYQQLTDKCPNKQTGKRIALPTRVEPKVFFANERTFLSWLNFTVILGALAIGMLNFGDRPAFISSFLFTGVAMATMIYALITYHWRAKSIRMRGQAGFDDRFGPTFLAVILFLAVVVNFVLRITYVPEEGGKAGQP